MLRLIVIVSALFMLSNCTKLDPARKDLKSPCAAVGIDFSGKEPCVMRFPSENILRIA